MLWETLGDMTMQTNNEKGESKPHNASGQSPPLLLQVLSFTQQKKQIPLKSKDFKMLEQDRRRELLSFHSSISSSRICISAPYWSSMACCCRCRTHSSCAPPPLIILYTGSVAAEYPVPLPLPTAEPRGE